MTKILFQGDSITHGEYEFINKGISGNRIIDLIARVKCDIIKLNKKYQ